MSKETKILKILMKYLYPTNNEMVVLNKIVKDILKIKEK